MLKTAPAPAPAPTARPQPAAAPRARPPGEHALRFATSAAGTPRIQRKCTCGGTGGMCPECQEKRRRLLQAKLTLGATNDPQEHEADAVADRVMRMPAGTAAIAAGTAPPPVVRREPAERDDEEEQGVQRTIRRQEAGEEEEQGEEQAVQAKRGGDGGGGVPEPVGAYIHSLPGRGDPLPESTRGFFEPRFGHGFGGVRVHTDAEAGRSAAAIDARAYTVGSDIVFGSGEYDPGSTAGQRLLAHELTHVVQQGAASPAPPAAGRRAPVASPAAAPAPGASPGTVRREPRETDTPAPLRVGDVYVVQTPKGGNLMLRVQPTPDRELQGSDSCDGAATCPNTVGNVASGTEARIKEVRSYGWYVVETKTIEHGLRTGFVQDRYLVPPTAAAQTPTVPEAPDVEVPEEDSETPVFGMGDAELESLEEGTGVEQFGVVATEDGTNLWPRPDNVEPKVALLPLNTKIFVDRHLPGGWSEVYVEKHQRGESLPVASGTHGFVATSRITTDMPDPDAYLYRITTPGQGALALAVELYPDYKPDCALGVAACRDHRFLVNVLVAVNEAAGRRWFYKENPDDAWDQAKLKRASTDGSGKTTGGQIWVPGMDLVRSLEGQIDSGSMTLEALHTLGDILIGIAAFIAGLLHGAVMSIADIFIGVWDLIVLAKDIIVKLIRGTLVSDAKQFWNEISKIKLSDIGDLVARKWNEGSVWTKWHFRGYVIGYAIVEILLLIFSGGIVTAVKWAGKAGKFGKLAKYLSELSSVKKVMEGAKALKGKGVDKLRKAMQAAEALSEAHGWAARALRLPLGILRRLSEADVGKLKKLPQWARERFAALADEAKLRLLGCNSPCKVDPDAIADALRLATKGGKALTSVDEVLAALKAVHGSFKIAKISRKLRRADSGLMKAITEAKLTDTDFAKLADFLTPGDLANQALAYRTFVRYLTSVVPAKVGGDIKEMNRIAAAIVKAEPRRGAALKGAMFEQWVALNIPSLASKSFGRITFDLKKLLGKTTKPYKRHVDKWVPGTGEIWDMKHTFDKVPTTQADDYFGLLGKTAPDGNKVNSVNYLFPTKEAAEANRHLVTQYNFGVHYIDEATNKLVKLP